MFKVKIIERIECNGGDFVLLGVRHWMCAHSDEGKVSPVPVSTYFKAGHI